MRGDAILDHLTRINDPHNSELVAYLRKLVNNGVGKENANGDSNENMKNGNSNKSQIFLKFDGFWTNEKSAPAACRPELWTQHSSERLRDQDWISLRQVNASATILKSMQWWMHSFCVMFYSYKIDWFRLQRMNIGMCFWTKLDKASCSTFAFIWKYGENQKGTKEEYKIT